MTGFWQLSFELGGLTPEAAEQACFDCGAGSVTFADAHDDPVLEPLPGEFRLWPSTSLRAVFPDTSEPEGIVSSLSRALAISPAHIGLQHLEDRIWEREWLRDFHAMQFGRRLWVCPHHEQVSAEDAVVVRLDPGLAFGTGTHPTTALCLEWLDAHVSPHCRVIDYGCGSGILALAAVKLGALEASCFDIDPQALIASEENARSNGLASRVRICQSTLALPRGADILVANILSGPLCELAPAFHELLRPGGAIMLAGLLQEEVAEVTQAYAACFDMSPFGNRDGWVGLAGQALRID